MHSCLNYNVLIFLLCDDVSFWISRRTDYHNLFFVVSFYLLVFSFLAFSIAIIRWWRSRLIRRWRAMTSTMMTWSFLLLRIRWDLWKDHQIWCYSGWSLVPILILIVCVSWSSCASDDLISLSFLSLLLSLFFFSFLFNSSICFFLLSITISNRLIVTS